MKNETQGFFLKDGSIDMRRALAAGRRARAEAFHTGMTELTRAFRSDARKVTW